MPEIFVAAPEIVVLGMVGAEPVIGALGWSSKPGTFPETGALQVQHAFVSMLSLIATAESAMATMESITEKPIQMCA